MGFYEIFNLYKLNCPGISNLEKNLIHRIKYKSIAELTFSQTRKLREIKIHGNLEEIEEIQLIKYFFQIGTLELPIDEENDVWNIFITFLTIN